MAGCVAYGTRQDAHRRCCTDAQRTHTRAACAMPVGSKGTQETGRHRCALADKQPQGSAVHCLFTSPRTTHTLNRAAAHCCVGQCVSDNYCRWVHKVHAESSITHDIRHSSKQMMSAHVHARTWPTGAPYLARAYCWWQWWCAPACAQGATSMHTCSRGAAASARHSSAAATPPRRQAHCPSEDKSKFWQHHQQQHSM
jgi:hypothetical protein